ncbi:MAG: hypothetical protein DBW63_12100 [Hyphomonas sp.]|nr:MAG: hypothetical protein DBW63_12100 [Hyphomonas sp.]
MVMYAKTWAANTLEKIRGPIHSIGSFCSIVAAFGGSMVGIGPEIWIIPATGAIYTAYASRPRQLRLASSMINQPGELRELQNILKQPEAQVGLVGLSDSGKTTFRDTLANRDDTVRTTGNTFEIFQINLAGIAGRTLLLIDSVGQDIELTSEVVRQFPNIAVFLDHNSGDSNQAVSQSRIRDHRVLLNNLSNMIKARGENLPKVFLVANKSDLWSREEKSARAMSNLLKYGAKALGRVLPGDRIFLVQDHSNRNSAKNTSLLREISIDA